MSEEEKSGKLEKITEFGKGVFIAGSIVSGAYLCSSMFSNAKLHDFVGFNLVLVGIYYLGRYQREKEFKKYLRR